MYIRLCVEGFEEVGGIDRLEVISGLVLSQSKTQLEQTCWEDISDFLPMGKDAFKKLGKSCQ